MFRNLYDVDCVTWSPQGRIFQLEYAMEAVKQGTCCVGLQSSKYAVLCSLRKAVSRLAEHHQKLFKIDESVGVAMSGLTADAKVICNFMRNEVLQYKYVFNAPILTGRLVEKVADKYQVATQRYSKRPFGVGLLVAGYDKLGPHIFETCPTGNFYECYAMAFGSRSQAAKTYLEKYFETFDNMPLEDLVYHGVKALKASLAQSAELSESEISVGIVGEKQPWSELSHDQLKDILDRIAVEEVVPAQMEVEEREDDREDTDTSGLPESG